MNDDHDPLIGLSPARPPAALRAHVLAVARHAATQQAPGLLQALYRDRLLRACAVGLGALVIANAIVTGGGRVPTPVADTAFAVKGDAEIPGDTGLTAAEQLDELAQELGQSFARSRG